MALETPPDPKMPNFTHVDPEHPPHGPGAVWKWGVVDRLSGRRRRSPAGPPAPWVASDPARLAANEGLRVTWIGHASFLIGAGPRNVLIDPVFSDRVGLAYHRFGRCGITIDQLPPIDLLLVTHAHYDHLDAPSVRALPRATPVVVPAGLGRWFRRRGFAQVRELLWWQSATVGDVRATLVPARHWSRRTPFDLNRSLWGGFVVETVGTAVYHAGDSARFEGFAEIGERFPALTVAMMPIGAYAPSWFMEHSHMTPEQAAEAFVSVGATRMIPMHWGAFRLTDEPLAEPAERLDRWWRARAPEGRSLLRPAVGETLVLETD